MYSSMWAMRCYFPFPALPAAEFIQGSAIMITISSLSYSYPLSSRILFDHLSASFSSGWTALIGPNGSGKLTLLRLIAGKLSPEEGSIYYSGTAAFCPQDQQELPLFFSDPDLMNLPSTFALMSRMGIEDDWPWRWNTLSGGEKKKCHIADALLRSPDVLLLDEPANHIDIATMQLLVRELKNYTGVGIIVSHDMSFLDALCTATILLTPADNGTQLKNIPLPPQKALEDEKIHIQALRSVQQKIRGQIDTLRQSTQQKQLELERNSKKLSKAGISSKDASAKAKVDAARLTGKDRRAGDAVARMGSRLLQVQTKLDGMNTIPGERKTGAGLQGKRERKPSLIAVPAGSMELAGGTILLTHPDLTVSSATRIAIMGANGTGKSSMLEALVGHLSIPMDSIWYSHQELGPEERQAVKEQVDALDSDQRGQVLSVVYRLGSEPQAVMTTSIPSPGETRKLLFGLALLRQVSAVFLDEPTNHLDVQAVQAWSEALAEFAGAVVVVTHDRAFTEHLANEVWNLTREQNTTTLEITGLQHDTKKSTNHL